VLDLGTGSGCILVSVLAERPDASGVGVDISPGALATAKANAEALGVADRAVFLEGGWQAGGEGFDLIVSNPPYIREDEMAGLAAEVRLHDPGLALTGGADGLGPYRVIPAEAMARLKPGGWLGLEFGQGQERDVAALMEGQGFAGVRIFADLAGISRAAFGRKPG
jgi:release factor glutamine methyltransferase